MVRRYNKVLIDIITSDNERMFVQDSKTQEWGVVTGGCKGTFQNFELVGERYRLFMDKMLDNAIRELQEEINVTFHKNRYMFTNKQYTFYTPTDLVDKSKLYSNKKQFIYYIYTIYVSKKERSEIINSFMVNDEIINIKFLNRNQNVENKWDLLNHLNMQ